MEAASEPETVVEIPWAQGLTSAEFLAFSRQNRPFVVRYQPSKEEPPHWAALERWRTPALLRSALATRLQPDQPTGSTSQLTVHTFLQSTPGEWPRVSPGAVALGDFVDQWLATGAYPLPTGDSDAVIDEFVGNVSLDGLEAALGDLWPPAPLALLRPPPQRPTTPDALAPLWKTHGLEQPVEKGRVWIGRTGHHSHLHFDAHDGLLSPIIGVKRVWLYSPLKHLKLIPRLGSKNAAAVNPLAFGPDSTAQAAWPGFAHAQPIEVFLYPGDILFIPTYWWHFVSCMEASVAVNYWLYPHLPASTLKFNALWPVSRNILRQSIKTKAEGGGGPSLRFQLLASHHVEEFLSQILRGQGGISPEWDELRNKASQMIREEIMDMIDQSTI